MTSNNFSLQPLDQKVESTEPTTMLLLNETTCFTVNFNQESSESTYLFDKSDRFYSQT